MATANTNKPNSYLIYLNNNQSFKRFKKKRINKVPNPPKNLKNNNRSKSKIYNNWSQIILKKKVRLVEKIVKNMNKLKQKKITILFSLKEKNLYRKCLRYLKCPRVVRLAIVVLLEKKKKKKIFIL